MSLRNQASKGHLHVGMILSTIALAFLLLCLFGSTRLYCIGVFVFGIWGGIETGRYIESFIRDKSE